MLLYICMCHLRTMYFMNVFFEWPSCQYVWMSIYPYAHMYICPYAHMCAKNVKNSRLSVHAKALFVCICANMNMCVEVFMLIHALFG